MARDDFLTDLRDELLDRPVDRRSFLKICSIAAAAVGLPASAAKVFAQQAEAGIRPPVIWLAFQGCTGCTESLLRTSHPDVGELILDLISLDYHDTLMVPAGDLAERSRHETMEKYAGQYVLVVEGAIPTKDDGVYCRVAGHNAPDLLKEVAEKAGAIIAIGSCASWGGIPSSGPNPTGAVGAHEVLEGKTVVNVPGCPANPYNFLGVVLQYATYGTLPELDDKGRPKFAYARVIHDDCPRRPHFDAGRFVQEFGDEGHRKGWCLYKMGCKGPQTHAPCSIQHFGEVVGAWPIGIGHPCFGCTEESIGFTVPLFDTVHIERPTPPSTYAPIAAEQGEASPWAAGAAGAVVGGLVGAGLVAGKKLGKEDETADTASEPEEE